MTLRHWQLPAVTCVALVTSFLVPQAAAAADAERAAHTSATASSVERTIDVATDLLDARDTELDSLEAALTGGQAALDSSAGRTLSDTERVALETSMPAIADFLATERDTLTDARASVPHVKKGAGQDKLDAAFKTVSAVINVELPSVTEQASTITAGVTAVNTAVSAWEAEQARIEAARVAEEARKEAARQEAIRQEALKNAPKSSTKKSAGGNNQRITPPADGSSARTFNIYVKARATMPHAQTLIDQGGQVAVPFSNGVTTIAAHQHIDPIALSMNPGDIVVLSGAASGTFRVGASISVITGSSSSQLTQLGTAYVMQTCFKNSNKTRLVALHPM